jgi:hypothetical protein
LDRSTQRRRIRACSVTPFPVGFGVQSRPNPVVLHRPGFDSGLIDKLVRLNPAGSHTPSKPAQTLRNPLGTDPRLPPRGFFPSEAKEKETVSAPTILPLPKKKVETAAATPSPARTERHRDRRRWQWRASSGHFLSPRPTGGARSNHIRSSLMSRSIGCSTLGRRQPRTPDLWHLTALPRPWPVDASCRFSPSSLFAWFEWQDLAPEWIWVDGKGSPNSSLELIHERVKYSSTEQALRG